MSANNLSAHLLNELKNIAKTAGFTDDYTIEQDIGSKPGDGFVADMVKIIITGKRNVNGTLQPEHLDLICKMFPAQFEPGVFCTEKLFEREAAMYNHIFPQMINFQKEKALTIENGFYAFPKCYYAISDIAKNEHMLIMEDLRPSGFAMWNKLEPIGFENVRLLMTALGRYHALSFAIRDQRPELFASFTEYGDVFMYSIDNSSVMQGMLNARCDQALRMFQKRPEHLAFLQRIKDTWRDVFRTAMNAGKTERSVIGHGDCWNNNMMYRNVAKGTGDICLLDWQVSQLGSPALDLSYFLMTSTTKPLRDQHFDEFLKIYYTELSATLRGCGSVPEKLFSFENLMSELKQFGRFGVTIAPMLLLHIENVSESSDIVDDEGTRDIGDSPEIRYLNRVSDVINDARSYGWIE